MKSDEACGGGDDVGFAGEGELFESLAGGFLVAVEAQKAEGRGGGAVVAELDSG
jgi:hypothetical protein